MSKISNATPKKSRKTLTNQVDVFAVSSMYTLVKKTTVKQLRFSCTLTQDDIGTYQHDI